MKLRRASEGGAQLTLEAEEVEFLRGLPEQLRAVYDAPPDDPARDRLFPRAYLDPTEERAEEEWQSVVHPELARERRAALDRLLESLDAAQPQGRRARVALSADDVSVWLAVLNDTRLALGTRLGIADDTDSLRISPDDPQAPERHAYAWLTMLQGELVEVLLRAMPG